MLFKRILLLEIIGIFFINNPCFGRTLFENESLVFGLDSYFRTDIVNFNNVVDLDSAKRDDATTYLGIDYSLGFSLEDWYKDIKLYLKLERNGPYDYGAPLFIHNTLINSSGQIDKYRNEQLLPNIEELWLNAPIFNPFRFKIGLYTYEVGNGFSLNGAYENYGFTIFRETEDFCWRFYYCRPDIHNKHRLGPKIPQERDQDIVYEPGNQANFFATDVKFKKEKNIFQPYAGALVDHTSSGKRDNLFTPSIKRDILGTFGLFCSLNHSDLTWVIELAHNFGRGKSDNPAFKDVYHTGYLIYTGLDYKRERFNPSFQLLICSGNKVTLEQVQNQETTFTSGKNRAFSYSSPLNRNISDSISSSNVDILPIVAMGGGYGLNYAVPRPRTFSSGDFDNLILPTLGFDFDFTEKLKIGLYGYYLRSFTRPIGMLNNVARFLSRDLGSEIDLFIDYQINNHTLISILGGYFFPGKYYKEKRDDTDGGLFNTFVRGDGNPDPAYQIELAVEFIF
jgi:hypothetical protein